VVEDIDVDKSRIIAQEAIGHYGRREAELRLEGSLGFEHRFFMSKVTLTTKIKNFSESAMLRGVRTVPRLCILYPGFRFTTEEISRKNYRSKLVENSN